MTVQRISGFSSVVKFCMYIMCITTLVMTFLGCKGSGENPYAVRAREKLKEGDQESAVRLLKEAIDDNPKVADIHLDLAILLHDYKQDYIGAIYHYQRYLDLVPQGQENSIIEERIRKAKQALVISPEFAGMHDERSGEALKKKLIELMEENLSLKERLKSIASKQSGKTGTSTSVKTQPTTPTTKKPSSGVQKTSSSSINKTTHPAAVTL